MTFPRNPIEVLPHDAPRDEWLDARRTGLGGSDMAAVLGVQEAFSSSAQVWLDKRGELPPTEPNAKMKAGHYFEPGIALWVADKFGLEPEPLGLLRDREAECLIATGDAKVAGRNAGIEYKYVSYAAQSQWGPEGIADLTNTPRKYRVQCLHYLGITGADVWYLTPFIEGEGTRCYAVERDEETIAYMRERAIEWWERHIVNGEVPEPTGHANEGQALASIYDSPTEKPVELGQDIADAVEAMEQAKDRTKSEKTEADRYTNAIKRALGNHTHGVLPDGSIVTWKPDRNGKRGAIRVKRA